MSPTPPGSKAPGSKAPGSKAPGSKAQGWQAPGWQAQGPNLPGALPPGTVALEIAADPSLVGCVRLLVSCLAATRRELSAERLDDLKLAVSEACTNAVDAYGPDADAPTVLVSWTEDEDGLEVRVTDRGRGYDPLQGLPHDSGRLGVRLIQVLVDEARWEPGNPGTTVTMSLSCPRAGPDED